jgi:hypothetical protein
MQYRSVVGSMATGVGFAIIVALANGLWTHVNRDGNTISEAAMERFGVN